MHYLGAIVFLEVDSAEQFLSQTENGLSFALVFLTQGVVVLARLILKHGVRASRDNDSQVVVLVLVLGWKGTAFHLLVELNLAHVHVYH